MAKALHLVFEKTCNHVEEVYILHVRMTKKEQIPKPKSNIMVFLVLFIGFIKKYKEATPRDIGGRWVFYYSEYCKDEDSFHKAHYTKALGLDYIAIHGHQHIIPSYRER
ncbi:hypothetical protein ACJX0J_012192 [Zea mays]